MNGNATNDELARRLFQRDSRMVPPAKPPTLEPLASVRDPGGPPQAWTLGGIPDAILRPVSEPERRALFTALNKGTKANLGREPTV
ncbi:MAG TPA: hypothetical protein VFS30_13935, partial [Dehalococcoidia bacterium]|nr:hypothetical protein [Dehalococcoidia bacterium]